MACISFLLRLGIITILCFSCNVQTSDRFDVLLREILRCENSGTNEINFSTTRLSKVTRSTFTYESNYTNKVPFDDNLSIMSDVAAWGNGGWRPSYLTVDTPHFCIGCKKLAPTYFQELIKNTGQTDCPIPPGTYEVNARNISFSDFKIPVWRAGKYRLINELYKEQRLVGCLGMVFEIVPKRRQSKKKKH